MRKALLLNCLLLVACLLHGQGTDRVQLKERLGQAEDLVIDGKRTEAAVQFRQISEQCRQKGDEFLAEEMDALYSLCGLEESLAGKKKLLQEMKDRAAGSSNVLLQGYIALAEAEIDKLEGHGDAASERLFAALDALDHGGGNPADERLVRATIVVTLAEFLAEAGQFETAQQFYQVAEQQLGEPLTRTETMYLGTILTGLGNAYRELNQLQEAQASLERARRQFELAKAQESRAYAYYLLNYGAFQASKEDRKGAVRTVKTALGIIPEPCVDRAEVLLIYISYAMMAGDIDATEAGLKEAEQLSSRFQMRPNWRISYYQLLAVLHSAMGRVKMAIEATDQALAILEKEDISNPKLISSLYKQQALNYSMMGDVETSEAYNQLGDKILAASYGQEYADYSASRRLGGDDGMQGRTDALLDEVQKDVAAGKTESALKKLDQMLDIYREDGIGGAMFLMTESLKLRLLESTGDTGRLKRAAETYLTDLRSDVRQNLSYMTEAEREAYYAGVMPSISFAYLAEKDAAIAAPVYNAVLLRKNFILGAGLSLEKLIADSGDSSLQGVLAEIKSLRSGPAKDPNLPAAERRAAGSRADSLENILIRKSHDYGDFLALSDIRWEDVRDALGPDEVAVEYIQSGTEDLPIYCMLILRKGWKQPRSIILAVDDEHLIESIADPDYAESVYGTSALYEVFWQPLEEFAKPGEKVYFAMDGFLNAFAFEHFTTDKGDRAMDRFELHRVSSTRELIGRKAAAHGRTAALFGGFDYNLSSEEVSYYASTTRSGSAGEEWGYLPGSLDEVEAADRILRGKLDVDLYTGEEGLESRFKALSGAAPDLLHVATHGYYFDGKSDPMERSGLVFSGANSLQEEGPAESGEDGLLTSAEIALLDLRGTDLIVLSACQSGVGSISSDGVYGLQRAFKKAGVRSILMSLWKVNDQVTAEMMRLFYTNLAAGQDIRAAFQAARETLRQTYPDPLLWAPFVLLES